ncbi:hypothetical protein T4B_9453 [Trichinella pseudospiralis]|uniref:Uncharacterized protein n=1 Tax=Trichinella pseudospiralis TaxID=6337 RepID=A0A0V1HRP1_TRIPS|nr:hypothetical protein T4A_6416 [Trichinella pseudospiralis]KRZ13390.1 hypothetical protein T4B_9453 [Trichinella pseudospiralis]
MVLKDVRFYYSLINHAKMAKNSPKSLSMYMKSAQSGFLASLAFCQWFDTSSTEQLIIGAFSSMDDNAFDEQLMQP